MPHDRRSSVAETKMPRMSACRAARAASRLSTACTHQASLPIARYQVASVYPDPAGHRRIWPMIRDFSWSSLGQPSCVKCGLALLRLGRDAQNAVAFSRPLRARVPPCSCAVEQALRRTLGVRGDRVSQDEGKCRGVPCGRIWDILSPMGVVCQVSNACLRPNECLGHARRFTWAGACPVRFRGRLSQQARTGPGASRVRP